MNDTINLICAYAQHPCAFRHILPSLPRELAVSTHWAFQIDQSSWPLKGPGMTCCVARDVGHWLNETGITLLSYGGFEPNTINRYARRAWLPRPPLNNLNLHNHLDNATEHPVRILSQQVFNMLVSAVFSALVMVKS